MKADLLVARTTRFTVILGPTYGKDAAPSTWPMRSSTSPKYLR